MTDEAFMEALLSFVSSIPTADIWQVRQGMLWGGGVEGMGWAAVRLGDGPPNLWLLRIGPSLGSRSHPSHPPTQPHTHTATRPPAHPPPRTSKHPTLCRTRAGASSSAGC